MLTRARARQTHHLPTEVLGVSCIYLSRAFFFFAWKSMHLQNKYCNYHIFLHFVLESNVGWSWWLVTLLYYYTYVFSPDPYKDFLPNNTCPMAFCLLFSLNSPCRKFISLNPIKIVLIFYNVEPIIMQHLLSHPTDMKPIERLSALDKLYAGNQAEKCHKGWWCKVGTIATSLSNEYRISKTKLSRALQGGTQGPSTVGINKQRIEKKGGHHHHKYKNFGAIRITFFRSSTARI